MWRSNVDNVVRGSMPSDNIVRVVGQYSME